MNTFICVECGESYGWVLESTKEKCAYCEEEYPDGTQCKGGKKKEGRS